MPRLATGWKASKNRLIWTFKLRKGVTFSRRDAVQRGRRLHELRPVVQLPRPAPDDALSYYWNTVFGGFAQAGARQPRPEQEPLQGLQGSRQVLRRRSSSAAVVLVPRRDRPAELRHREPDGAEEVPGRRGHGRRDRRLPPDGNVRDAAPGRHRPVHAPVVAARQQARPRRATTSTGARRRRSSGSSTSRSATMPPGSRRCSRVRCRPTTTSVRRTSPRSRATRSSSSSTARRSTSATSASTSRSRR